VDETENALIQAARSDPRAFGELYERYLQRVYSYVYYRTGNAADAEDLTSRVFPTGSGAPIQLLGSGPAIRRLAVPPSPTTWWPTGAAIMVAIRRCRSTTWSPAPTTCRTPPRREERALVQRAVASLRPSDST